MPPARIRTFKIDFFQDRDLCGFPYEYRLLFLGLWPLADREGRLEDNPIIIKAHLFPYDSVDVELILETLAQPKRKGGPPFIHRYAANGKEYIQIVNFTRHQRPHHTEKQSEIPPHGELTVKPPLDHGDPTVDSRLGREGKGRERKGKEVDLPSRSEKPVDKSPTPQKDNGKGRKTAPSSDQQALENLAKILDEKRKIVKFV